MVLYLSPDASTPGAICYVKLPLLKDAEEAVVQEREGQCRMVLRYVNLPNHGSVENLLRRRILDLTLRESDLSAHLQQPISSVDPPVRQDDRVALDITLGVVRVRHVTGEVVELGRADRADGCGRGACVRTATGELRVAGWCLQSG